MRISICGDVSPAGSNDLFIKGETEELFHDVPSAFKDSDRVLINLEVALTDGDTPIFKKGPNIKASPLCVNVLKEIGVTDCGISNNHIFDYGVQGLQDTIKAVTEAGFNYTGFGANYEDARKNLIIEKDGISVAILAVCEHEYSYALADRMGARGFDPYDTLEDIREAKKSHDYVIVTYHGGKEQCVYPSPRLRKVCQAMVRSGADVVLCQHSHCIGCYEEYQGGHILYGQGNFHFTNRRDHPHWQSGLIVQLDISDKIAIDFVPVKVVGCGIELAKDGDKEQIMASFRKQSSDLHNGKWLEGWDDFCKEMRDNYIGFIARAYTENATETDNDIFDGRLYIEAHRDVIEWLCKHPWEVKTKL